MFNTRIPLYGVFIIISIFSGLLIVYRNSNHLNLKTEETIGLLAYIGLGAIFGAKYFTFLANHKRFNGIFDFTKIGLSSYGAVIGIIAMMFLFSKQYKKSFKNIIYILLPSIPLMYGIGKIGCFLAGCCHGIEYKGPMSVSYYYSYSAPKGINLFPTQLLEAIIFIGIFIYTYKNQRNKKANNKVIGQTFVICGVSKFLLDYLRMSHSGIIISINQVVSLVFIVIGIYLIINKEKNEITNIK